MFAAALVLALSVQLASALGGCPGDYVAVGYGATRSCLLLSSVKENYVEARSLCGSLYYGKLVTAETKFRRANLKQFLMENTMDSDFIYIGAQEDTKKQKFFWEGFSTAAFWNRLNVKQFPEIATSWRYAEPDNSNGNESCVCAKTDGLWNDCKCVNAKRYFVCERR